ncbi:MAG: DUF2817 domain-containing protein [Comamonadaceae bacterium]|nr:MAG: DUF2817 domain-containing protein [Comamonadaceae bacterium]
MIGKTEGFSSSYREAREKFLASTKAAGLTVESHLHPEKGRDGEELAMDVAIDGPADARNLLIITSACHGVEGYCGTGVQVFALHDEAWRAKARAAGVTVMYVHALNPYGFSHIRRTTHENVDLNRNFRDYSQPLEPNLLYREVHDLLLPEQWPPGDANAAAVANFIVTRGQAAWQAAISGGQPEFPDGLFFGGTGPTWSNLTYRDVLRRHARQASRIAWIDIHTGLGPSGHGERIFAGADDDAAIARARAWWGDKVTSIYDGSSTSAKLTGMAFAAVYEECPQAEYTGIAMEYGTVPILQVMQALRAEHWLNIHRDAPAPLAEEIRQQMMDAFYTDTDAWKVQVIDQAREALFQSVEGLKA